MFIDTDSNVYTFCIYIYIYIYIIYIERDRDRETERVLVLYYLHQRRMKWGIVSLSYLQITIFLIIVHDIEISTNNLNEEL